MQFTLFNSELLAYLSHDSQIFVVGCRCVQAKSILSPSSTSLVADGQSPQRYSSSASTNGQLTIWPILVAAGTENVATSVVAGS